MGQCMFPTHQLDQKVGRTVMALGGQVDGPVALSNADEGGEVVEHEQDELVVEVGGVKYEMVVFCVEQ